MKLGEHVPGIMTEGVFFVEEDLYGIAQRVKAYDDKAALVVNKAEAWQIGIARHVQDPKWAPGGAWIIAFWCNDQETGDPIMGEPDARVMHLMEKFDSTNRGNSEKLVSRARKVLAMREYRRLTELRERAKETAVESVSQWRQARGIKSKIFVPRTAVGV